MKRLTLILFLSLFANSVWAATFYIDPTCATPGDGTGQTCSGGATDPFDQWADVTWTAGNSYYQKAGTVAAETVTVGTTGTSGNQITVGAYGTSSDAEYAKVDCASTRANGITSQGKQYVTIQDFEVYGCTGNGISHVANSTRNSTGSKIYRVYVHDNGTNGAIFATVVGSDPAASTDVEIDGCIAENNGQHGCAFTTAATNPILENCTATGNSHAASGWGCYISPRARTITSGWTQVSGTVYNVTVTAGEGIDKVIWPSRTPGSGPYVLTQGTFGSLTADQWAVSGTTLQTNIGNPNAGNVIIVIGASIGGTIRDSAAYAQSAAFDGIGIGCDLAAEDCIIERVQAWGNPGAGIECNVCKNPTVRSSIAWNNGTYGLSLPTIEGTGKAQNLTLSGNTTSQIFTTRIYTGQTVTLTNNALYGGAAAVTGASIGGTVTDDYARHGNQSGTAYSGVTAGANSAAAAPRFLGGTSPTTAEGFRPLSSSPLLGAGSPLGAKYDYEGYRFGNPPNIGAFVNNGPNSYSRRSNYDRRTTFPERY